jgi:hypothetical protein
MFDGFWLTSIPLVRAGLAASAIVSTALAADTISITIMELIDNLTVVIWPDAIEAGVGDPVLIGRGSPDPGPGPEAMSFSRIYLVADEQHFATEETR